MKNRYLTTTKAVANYVNSRLDSYPNFSTSNISIWLPKITDSQIKSLGRKFKVVKRELFGYVYFER